MKICIGYQSALEYWRVHRTLPENSALRQRNIVLPKKPPITKQVKSSGLELPLHIMLRSPENRWVSSTMIQHVFSGDTPAGCFISTEIGTGRGAGRGKGTGNIIGAEISSDDVFEVSAPEFCFLQMAEQLSLVGLIELGYELCGKYSMPVDNDAQVPTRGFYNRPPLTSAKRISAFIARVPGFRGRRSANLALRHILDGSASPMETKLSMLLTLPYRLGGFGLPKPDLNTSIFPSKTDSRSSGKGFYTCDLFWPDHDLAVEYDSDQFHTGSEHIADDSKKRNSLAMMGVTVITITTQQLFNLSDFKKAVNIIAKRVGKRLEFKDPGFDAAHRELRNQLLPK